MKKTILALVLISAGFSNEIKSQDLISGGVNSWIFHTPDDSRTTLHIAPKTGGIWQWGKQTVFYNNGNVLFNRNIGIGAYPQTRLDVNGTIKTRGTDFVIWNNTRGGNGTSHGRALVHLGTGTKASSQLVINYANDFAAGTKVNSNLEVTGNVGIGLANSPSDTKLYIKANNNQKVGIVSEVYHTEDNKFGIISAVNRVNTKAFSVLLKEDGSYKDKFVVMGNGNVRATQVRVKTNIFPDYVFEDNYTLMPLSEVDNFIKKNKHLPNIPKAEKIIEEGLNLGEIQVKQMEKIEELYLYIIELEKRVKQLEKNLKEVESN